MIDHTLWNTWRARLVECSNSGLPITEFCRQNDLNPRKYYYWKVQIERADGIRQTAGLGLLRRRRIHACFSTCRQALATGRRSRQGRLMTRIQTLTGMYVLD